MKTKGVRCLDQRWNFEVGDIVKLKKPHPCGSHEWEILRVGADFRLKCMGCGHQVMTERKMVEKNARGLTKAGNAENACRREKTAKKLAEIAKKCLHLCTASGKIPSLTFYKAKNSHSPSVYQGRGCFRFCIDMYYF